MESPHIIRVAIRKFILKFCRIQLFPKQTDEENRWNIDEHGEKEMKGSSLPSWLKPDQCGATEKW